MSKRKTSTIIIAMLLAILLVAGVNVIGQREGGGTVEQKVGEAMEKMGKVEGEADSRPDMPAP